MKILTKTFKHEFTLSLSANLFSYLINFSAAIIYVHFLSLNQYGVYSFAFGIISLFLLVNGLGVNSGLLQYVSKHANDLTLTNAYLSLSLILGLGFNFLVGLVIIVYSLIFQLPLKGSREILLLMAFFPVGRLYIDIFQAYLRARSLNILQAKFLLTNNFILILINLIGVYFFQLYGLIIASYIGYLIMFFYSRWQFKLPHFNYQLIFKIPSIKAFLSYSWFSALSNAFSGLVFVLDTLIIAYVLKDASKLASYKVATIIPFAINFIPNLVMNYYYPQIVANHDKVVVLRQIARKLTLGLLAFSLTTSILLVVLAPLIVPIFFGVKYQDSILIFQILSGAYFIIAAFRTVNGNILAALGRARLNFYLTSVFLGLNIIITYLLVKTYGIIGSSIAVVIMYIISSVIGFIALRLILRNKERL